MNIRTVRIDTSRAQRRLDRFFQACVGSENLGLALRCDYLEHLTRCQEEIGFRYLRSHGFLIDLLGLVRVVDGHIRLNFQTADKVFDEWLRRGIRPFVEFGFMPEALASGTQTIFWYRGNVTPPKDLTTWASVIERCIEHWVDRYGREEVLGWRFEVWNEPDLEDFWSGGQQRYFELYEATARAVKRVDPRLKVGGPATSRCQWIEAFVEFCQRYDVPLDFISTHHYCADSALDLDGTATTVYRGQAAMRVDVLAVRDQIKRAARTNLELHFTEWNITPISRDPFGHDSEFTAAFVLQTLKDVSGLVDSYSWWGFTDIEEHMGPREWPFDGSFGLVSAHGLRKPVFHAYHWLSRMYDDEWDLGDAPVRASGSPNGDLRIVAWNLVEPTRADFRGGEWEVPERPLAMRLEVTGLNSPTVVRSWVVDRRRGNAYRAWQRMGSPQYLRHSDLDALKADSAPVLVREQRVDVGATLILEDKLETNAIMFHEIAGDAAPAGTAP